LKVQAIRSELWEMLQL